MELSLFIQSYLQEFRPQNEDESAALESMVRAHWLKRCLWKLEDDLFSTEIRELRLLYPDAAYNTLLALAFCSLAEEGGALDFINRAEDDYDRQYTRALSRLKRLRKKNKISKRT